MVSAYPSACHVGIPGNISPVTSLIDAREYKRTQATGNKPASRCPIFCHGIDAYVEIVNELLAIAICEVGVVYGGGEKVSPDILSRITSIHDTFNPSAVS